jgi:hypothetical protein
MSSVTAIDIESIKNNNSITTSLQDEVALYYYLSEAWNGVGGASGTYEAAIRLTQEEVINYESWWLTSVRFYHNVVPETSETHSVCAKIYDEGTLFHPGNLLTYELHTVTGDGWFRIDLSEPIEINSAKDIWVSIEITYAEGEYPIGIDAGPAVYGKGAWVYWKDEWKELPSYDLNYNWNIEALISESEPVELDITKISGLIGVKANVANIDDSDATDIPWAITITGGVHNRINKTTTGTIHQLPAGAEKIIHSYPLFGFGKLTITIEVEKITREAKGYLIGPFVIGVSII